MYLLLLDEQHRYIPDQSAKEHYFLDYNNSSLNTAAFEFISALQWIHNSSTYTMAVVGTVVGKNPAYQKKRRSLGTMYHALFRVASVLHTLQLTSITY